MFLVEKCYGLRQRQLKKSYKDKIRPSSHSIWKPPARRPRSQDRSCDSESRSCDHQGGSCDLQDKPSTTQGGDSLRIQILTKSLFPYVKKLSSKEIANIKNKLQPRQDSSLQQVGVADQTCTSKQSSDHIDHQTKADHQIHEDTAVKKRSSLSLKRRKKKQDDMQSQKSPFKKRKFSPVKKLNISSNEQDLIKSLQSSQDCNMDTEDAVSSTFDVPSTLRYCQLQFVVEECSTSSDSQPHHHDDDNFDALHNMGYLSPMINTTVDSDYHPGQSSSLLLSPFKCSSPTPSSPDSQLNTSFSLVLPSSSSNTPEHSSSSSHTDDSPSPSPHSLTSFGNVLDIVFGDCQVQYDLAVTSAGSHDQEQDKGLCDHVVDTPPDNDAISYISESPRSKLSDSAIHVDADDNVCTITPALAPPTSSHLLETLDHYGIPYVLHEQLFCSNPRDVPPAK